MPGKRSATESQCQPSFQVFKSFTVHLSTLEQVERGWGGVCVRACMYVYAVTLNIVTFFHDFLYKLSLVSLFSNQVNVHLLLTVVFFF